MLKKFLPVLCGLCIWLVQPALHASNSVSWSIGNDLSSLDGGASKGAVTFTWSFDRPIKQGVYLDGTPWVLGEPGLKLISVTPAMKTEDLLLPNGEILANGIADATVINLEKDRVQLDQRIGSDAPGLWNSGEGVWDGQPIALSAGDCIATGSSRRDARDSYRNMLFNAIGVCNIVEKDMTGHFRPPIRMSPELRAKLITPKEVMVGTLPALEVPEPLNWAGDPVILNFSAAVGYGDADRMLNGPIANCGLPSHLGYETANGTLNHDLSGKSDVGYQRDVSDRIAECLYAAFDRNLDPAKRQRNLNKFIQISLDYYYMHSLGYPVWNGGGGHQNGLEGAITIAGAILNDPAMTDAIKYQRFLGDAIGENGKIYDMRSGGTGTFSRSEALHTVIPAAWQSGELQLRPAGAGAENLAQTLVRLDMAREDLPLNVRAVPYTAIETKDNASLITIDPEYVWPLYTRHRATDARRCFRFLSANVIRIEGDKTIRKIMSLQGPAGEDWTEQTWTDAKGMGGSLLVYPALSADELRSIKQNGNLATGVCTKSEADQGEIVLWESWPVSNQEEILKGFNTSPSHDYLENKLGDQTQWLPFYHVLNDPGASGKKLFEESPTYAQVKRFLAMQRDFGSYFWDQLVGGHTFPRTLTNQALTRYYLLDNRMPEHFVKTYKPSDKMWFDDAK